MTPEIDTVLVLNEVGQQVHMKLLKPLYTADQLRQAKVEVLREAAMMFDLREGREILNRMADEIERSKT